MLHSLSLKRPTLVRVTSSRLFINLAVAESTSGFILACYALEVDLILLETSGQPFSGSTFSEEPRQGTTEVLKQVALSPGPEWMLYGCVYFLALRNRR